MNFDDKAATVEELSLSNLATRPQKRGRRLYQSEEVGILMRHPAIQVIVVFR